MARIDVKNGFFLIDDEDVHLLSEYRKPIINSNGYVVVQKKGVGKQKNVRLHRIIMNAPDGMEVDHINHIRHDNRRSNLRLCSVSENRRNSFKKSHGSSKYRGVYFHKGTGRVKRWQAYLRIDGKKKSLGYFHTDIEAAIAYNNASRVHYGEFSVMNIITK